jgi:hypothetical protein
MGCRWNILLNVLNDRDLMMVYFTPKLLAWSLIGPIKVWLCMICEIQYN